MIGAKPTRRPCRRPNSFNSLRTARGSGLFRSQRRPLWMMKTQSLIAALIVGVYCIGCATVHDLDRATDATRKMIDAANEHHRQVMVALKQDVADVKQAARDEKTQREAVSEAHEQQVKNIERWVGVGATVAGIVLTYLTFRRDGKGNAGKV